MTSHLVAAADQERLVVSLRRPSHSNYQYPIINYRQPIISIYALPTITDIIMIITKGRYKEVRYFTYIEFAPSAPTTSSERKVLPSTHSTTACASSLPRRASKGRQEMLLIDSVYLNTLDTPQFSSIGSLTCCR